MAGSGTELGARLRARDTSAAPAALNLVESRTPRAHAEIAALLREVSPAALGGEAPGHVVGVTGPPGAGKSTLLGELVRVWRSRGRTVGALAVDPSPRRSGGALLGDRARIPYDPADDGAFIRSTAAAGRLRGLGPATPAGARGAGAPGGGGGAGGRVRRRGRRDRRRRPERDRHRRGRRHRRGDRPAGLGRRPAVPEE